MFSGGFGGFGGFGGREEQEEEQKEVNTTEYYELLGCDKKATCEQVRKAFRKKALKEHPDKGGDPQKFKKITAAYQVLSNPEKRQLYDQYGQEGVKNGGPPGGSGFGGLFDMFSGRGRRDTGPRKGKPKLVQLQVTLNQVYSGVMKTVKITRTRNCETCEGKGGQNVTKCTKCKGRGLVEKLVQLGPGMYSQTQVKCDGCKGQGQIMKEEDRCKTCKGEKVKKVQKVLEVAIQSGCPEAHDYIFTGQNDEYPGIIPGDVYVRIKIQKHKEFQRRGADLVYVKKISLLEALTGVKLEIKHLDGKKYVIATAPGEVLSHTQLKTVKKLGLPFYKDPMGHGNLYIQFLVEFPKKNAFAPDKLSQLRNILGGMDAQPQKVPKNQSKILQTYSDDCLNPSEMGGNKQQQRGRQSGMGGGRQQVQCQQQ